jgi:hypothetical protein
MSGGDSIGMFVISEEYIHPTYFILQCTKLENHEAPIKSTYPSANQPFWLVDAQPGSSTDVNTIETRKIIQWKTPICRLNQLGYIEKQAINCIKNLLNESDSAVWFHDRNSDMCSRFKQPHLHVIIKSNYNALSSDWQCFHDQYQYKQASKASRAASGYLLSIKIKHLKAAIRYFNFTPRVFMGTHSIVLGKLRQSLAGKSSDAFELWDDGDDDSETEGVYAASSSSRLIGDDFRGDNEDTCAGHIDTTGKRKRPDEWDIDTTHEFGTMEGTEHSYSSSNNGSMVKNRKCTNFDGLGEDTILHETAGITKVNENIK